MAAEGVLTLATFVDACEGLSIPYVVGGSLASGVHGEPRATHDVDVLVDVGAQGLAGLIAALQPHFYVDEVGAQTALSRAGAFNVIHLRWYQKIDVFIAGSWLDREQLERRERASLAADLSRTFFVTSAEVILLRKLDWFRIGGGASERQWRDVLAIVKAKRADLDVAYLREGAARLDVLELLRRAYRESGCDLNR